MRLPEPKKWWVAVEPEDDIRIYGPFDDGVNAKDFAVWMSLHRPFKTRLFFGTHMRGHYEDGRLSAQWYEWMGIGLS